MGLREMQMLMAQGAAAPAALTLVAVNVRPPDTGTPVGTFKITLPEAVQVGDQIIVACSYGGTVSTVTFSDSAGSAYQASQTNNTATGVQQCALATIATAQAAGALTVNASPNIAASGQMVVYHLRGASLSIDAANVQIYLSPAQPGTTPTTVGPYSTSARAFMVALPQISQNGSNWTMSITGAASYTVDVSGGAIYLSNVLHKLTSAALSGETFTFQSNNSGNSRATYLLVPFTY